MKGVYSMSENFLKTVKITIGEETKIFLLGQNNVTKREIEKCYKAYCEDFGSKVNMKDFLKNINQYGIELIDISDNEITHIIL
jgi:hypothetical protein